MSSRELCSIEGPQWQYARFPLPRLIALVMTIVKPRGNLAVQALDILYFNAALIFASKPERVLTTRRIVVSVDLVGSFIVVIPINTPNSLDLPAKL